MSLPLQKQHFINDEFVDSISPATFKTVNPVTEDVIAEVQMGGKADIDKAVKAAREAFAGKWETSTGSKRRDLLWKLADLVDKHADRLAEIESLDNGKSVEMAKKCRCGIGGAAFPLFLWLGR